MTTLVHHVTVTPSTEYRPPSAQFECRGDITSPCHRYPDCECESWDVDHDENHPATPHDECWMTGWFESENGATYDGPDGYDMNDNGLPNDMDRSGPIQAHYDLEGFVSWKWAA
jgi:hypothetical protein